MRLPRLAALLLALVAVLPLRAEEAASPGGLPLPKALQPCEATATRGLAAASALDWLHAHQAPDGHWGSASYGRHCYGRRIERDSPLPGRGRVDGDVLVTALATAAYGAARFTPQDDHAYAAVIEKALGWLVDRQDEEGRIAGPGAAWPLQSHALATVALVEALGLAEDPRWDDAARRAVSHLLATQSEDGLWREGPPVGLDATTWAIMALRSVQLVDAWRARRHLEAIFDDAAAVERAFARTRAWLDAHADLQADDCLGVAQGMILRIFMGSDPRKDPWIQDAARLLEANPPTSDPPGPTSDLAYAYFGTIALWQVGGMPWKTWNEHLKTAVIDVQRRRGHVCEVEGSWDPRGPWCDALGRVASTSLGALCLVVYYRYGAGCGEGGVAPPSSPNQARGTWQRSKLAPHAARVLGFEGDGVRIESARIAAEVCGVRARVTLDLWIRNTRSWPTEGRLELRLPDGAAPYYLAFGKSKGKMAAPFVPAVALGTDLASLRARQTGTWGTLKEARMVRTLRARRAYEETVQKRVDPALLTWAGAGVFDLGVFPLVPEKLHRVVVAYELDLTPVGGDLELRLDLPEGVPDVAAAMRARGAPATTSPEATCRDGGYVWDNPASREIRVLFPDPGDAVLQGQDGAGQPYFAAWIRPPVGRGDEVEASSCALILVDTSGSIAGTRFAMRRDLLESLLEENRHALRSFALATFDTEFRWWKDAFVENTPENAAAAIAHVVSQEPAGATDLAHALRASDRFPGDCDVFLLSDGATTWGTRDQAALVAVCPSNRRIFAYRTSFAGEADDVLQAIAEATDGALISIRGPGDVPRAARAHRHGVWWIRSLQIPGVTDLFASGGARTVYNGQRLLLVGRGTPEQGASLSMTLAQGARERTLDIPLPEALSSPMAARAYGYAAVSWLEEMGTGWQRAANTYASHFRVVRASTALLMLETEKDYRKHGIWARPVDAPLAVEPVTALLRDAPAPSRPVPATAREAWLELLSRPAYDLPPSLLEGIRSLPAERLSIPVRTGKMQPGIGDRAGLGHDLEQQPGDLGLLLRAAWAAEEGGRVDRAYRSLLEAASDRPRSHIVLWHLARFAEALGRHDLALLAYEVALSFSGRGGLVWIIAHDYRRFLHHVEAGRRDVLLRDFALARAASLAALDLPTEADRVVFLVSNRPSRGVDLAVVDERGRTWFWRLGAASTRARFVGDARGGARMLVVPDARAGPFTPLVLGPRPPWASGRGDPVRVQVCEFCDWGRETETSTVRELTLKQPSDAVLLSE